MGRDRESEIECVEEGEDVGKVFLGKEWGNECGSRL